MGITKGITKGTFALVVTLAAAAGSLGCQSKSKEAVLQAEEDSARFETEKKGRAVKGIGEGLQTAGKDGAQALSKGVGDVFKGTAKGFDQSLAAVRVVGGAGVAEAGLSVERASRQRSDPPAISLYLASDRAFSGTLRLRALREGREVGRSQMSVARQAGEAGYLDFSFDPRVPLGTVSELELVVLAR